MFALTLPLPIYFHVMIWVPARILPFSSTIRFYLIYIMLSILLITCLTIFEIELQMDEVI